MPLEIPCVIKEQTQIKIMIKTENIFQHVNLQLAHEQAVEINIWGKSVFMKEKYCQMLKFEI